MLWQGNIPSRPLLQSARAGSHHCRISQQDGLQRLLSDLGLVERRPLQFPPARDRFRRAFGRVADRGRCDPVQLMSGQAGRKGDEIVDVGGQCRRKDPFGDAPAPVKFHGSSAQQGRLRVFGRARAFLDHRARQSAPAKLARKGQAHGTSAHDQHRSIQSCGHATSPTERCLVNITSHRRGGKHQIRNPRPCPRRTPFQAIGVQRAIGPLRVRVRIIRYSNLSGA